MEDIIKISWRFWFETIQNDFKEQKGDFLVCY